MVKERSINKTISKEKRQIFREIDFDAVTQNLKFILSDL